MQIGAIGASYSPYIYNTNRVSSASLNKISAIGDDLLKDKTDFSELSSQETTNPLKRGESLDFMGILGMQMQMSRMNASRVMKEPQAQDESITQAAGLSEKTGEVQPDTELNLMRNSIKSVEDTAVNAVEESENQNSSDSMEAFENMSSAAANVNVINQQQAAAVETGAADKVSAQAPNAYDYARMIAAYQPYEMYA